MRSIHHGMDMQQGLIYQSAGLGHSVPERPPALGPDSEGIGCVKRAP